MLETAPNVNRKLVSFQHMKRIIIQIYEVQSPSEAETLIELGVDHIGSVIVSEQIRQRREIRDTINIVNSSPAKSSLIPLFNDLDSVLHTLDYYQPDIVHFCEALTDQSDVWGFCEQLIYLQENVKKRYPEIKIMRSIPISQSDRSAAIPTLEFGRRFEPVSDFFLTDTLLNEAFGHQKNSQPVQGFVGITGQTCDWNTAKKLVKSSRIPVILAGGLSPQNVIDGLRMVQPAGVDSCTQTNALDKNGCPIRFKKDPNKVRRLVEAVRQAEQTITQNGT